MHSGATRNSSRPQNGRLNATVFASSNDKLRGHSETLEDLICGPGTEKSVVGESQVRLRKKELTSDCAFIANQVRSIVRGEVFVNN